MTDVLTRLEANLGSEAEAYGYTLCVWGAGALLIHSLGVPGVERALAYVAGALEGFGTLAVVAFRGVTTEVTAEELPSSPVASTVHVLATGGTLGTVHLFLLVTVTYNLLLLIEELAARVAA